MVTSSSECAADLSRTLAGRILCPPAFFSSKLAGRTDLLYAADFYWDSLEATWQKSSLLPPRFP